MSVPDRDRIYWYLAVTGPHTLPELRTWLGWTTHRTNQALYALKKSGEVRLTKHHSVMQPHPYGAKACGVWEAITVSEVKERANCALIDAVEKSA